MCIYIHYVGLSENRIPQKLTWFRHGQVRRSALLHGRCRAGQQGRPVTIENLFDSWLAASAGIHRNTCPFFFGGHCSCCCARGFSRIALIALVDWFIQQENHWRFFWVAVPCRSCRVCHAAGPAEEAKEADSCGMIQGMAMITMMAMMKTVDCWLPSISTGIPMIFHTFWMFLIVVCLFLVVDCSWWWLLIAGCWWGGGCWWCCYCWWWVSRCFRRLADQLFRWCARVNTCFNVLVSNRLRRVLPATMERAIL